MEMVSIISDIIQICLDVCLIFLFVRKIKSQDK